VAAAADTVDPLVAADTADRPVVDRLVDLPPVAAATARPLPAVMDLLLEAATARLLPVSADLPAWAVR
jgi:hypothetical protein